MTQDDMSLPLPLGTVVEPWGEIGAVHWKDGERSYFMVKDGVVSRMPADVVERTAPPAPPVAGNAKGEAT